NKGHGTLASVVRGLRSVRRYSLHLHAVAEPCVLRIGGSCLFDFGLDVPFDRKEIGTDHAGYRSGYALDDAPKLIGFAFPADARQTRAAVVVAGNANLLLSVFDRRRYRACGVD